MRQFAACLLLVSGVLCAQNPAHTRPAADSWKSLHFLVGTWHAKTQGGSAAAARSGTYTFQLELGGHVLARHATTTGCAGPAEFNCEHDDLLYVYRETSDEPIKAIYFDTEGHVINYDVTVPAADTVVFISPRSQHGPQFRLVYELKDRVMHGRFQMRMPDQNEFKSYLEWSGEKK